MARKIVRIGGTLTLIGSGEMAPSMGKVYRALLSRMREPVVAAFVDTPAGFQLNTDQISAKAIRYFRQRLNVDLTVASFKSAATATPDDVERALTVLRAANLILAGPGSPGYAVRNWRDTPVLGALARRLAEGAHLLLASAAAIAVGRYALPVYQIYKVGDDPHWLDGLDLLQPYGLDLAIVPHWNNAEGGTYDTRYCFMGEPRFRLLEQCLPDSTLILGIDEHTACILDLRAGSGQVMGAGNVTIRHRGRENTLPTGTVFGLGQLKGINQDEEAADVLAAPASPPPMTGEQAVPAAQTEEETQEGSLAQMALLIDLLIDLRTRLRAGRNWRLADEIRERLSSLGIVLEDGPAGTTWRMR